MQVMHTAAAKRRRELKGLDRLDSRLTLIGRKTLFAEWLRDLERSVGPVCHRFYCQAHADDQNEDYVHSLECTLQCVCVYSSDKMSFFSWENRQIVKTIVCVVSTCVCALLIITAVPKKVVGHPQNCCCCLVTERQVTEAALGTMTLTTAQRTATKWPI